MTGVEAARVGKPHGLAGAFGVWTRDPDLLTEGVVVAVAGVERRIVERGGTDKRPVLRLEGVDTREAADALRDEMLVLVDRPPLEEDEYWADDLVGCEVVGLGTVTRLLAYPSCEVIEVDGGDHLVPLIRDAVKSIDLAARRIEVDLRFLNAD